MKLGERLSELAQTQPAKPAIHLQGAGRPDHTISYAELWSGALQYAGAYQARGLEPGDVVILILQHGKDLVFAFWGAIACGVVPSIMPFLTEKLSPEQYRHDLKVLITVTQPAAVLTAPEFDSELRQALQDESSPRLMLTTEARSDVTGNVELSGPTRGSEDIVLLQHSSGTTGLQKGVALSHRAVFNQLRAYGQTLGLGKDDVVVSWLPLYHDMGLIAGFLMPILSGIPLVLSSPFDWVRAPWRLLRAVSDYRGTLSWLPNFAYNFMAGKVRDRDLEGVDLSTWRAVINCSEPVRHESHKAFFERFKNQGLRWTALQTCYAMAENVFGVTQSSLLEEPVTELVDGEEFIQGNVVSARENSAVLTLMSSGTALPNTEVAILAPDGKRLPDRQMGEVALRSDCMLTGYYRRPDADAAAFRDGWYLTGDLGFLSAGQLYVVGRKKDLIIVGGKNIYPQDLEALSYEVPGIHPGRSVAFGVFNESLGTEDVYMVAEAETEDPAEQARLAEDVRQHVTKNSAVALRYVRVVEPKWILKTSSGKTARAANRDKFLKEMGATPRE